MACIDATFQKYFGDHTWNLLVLQVQTYRKSKQVGEVHRSDCYAIHKEVIGLIPFSEFGVELCSRVAKESFQFKSSKEELK